MAHTADQRDQKPMCGAKKKNGEICRAFAGQGTDHYGFGTCKFHGGSMPNHKKHAAALEAKQRMVAMGVPMEGVSAVEALMNELAASAGHVSWLNSEIAAMKRSQLGKPENVTILRLYDSERDRLTRISKACVDSGVAEATVRVKEAEVTVIGEALARAAFAAGLNKEMVRRLGEELRRELAKVDAKPKKRMRLAKPMNLPRRETVDV